MGKKLDPQFANKQKLQRAVSPGDGLLNLNSLINYSK